jgi:hypothetical protein
MVQNIEPAWMTPGGTISRSPTFNSTWREPTAAPPPHPGPFSNDGQIV